VEAALTRSITQASDTDNLYSLSGYSYFGIHFTGTEPYAICAIPWQAPVHWHAGTALRSLFLKVLNATDD
jgi:hypothetical protein